MLEYTDHQTASDFQAGYANSIDDAVVEKWERIFRDDSARVLSGAPECQHLVYGPRERNRIDFFPAQNVSGPAPLLVAIHGGLWFLFDRWMMHFLAPAFTRRGFHVAAINYPLAPKHSLGEIVEDCRSAVSWLYERAGEFGICRGAISVLGHSAAGQLAAMVAATDWRELSPGLPQQIIHRSVAVSGFYDIEPFYQTSFHTIVGFSLEDYRQWNPVENVGPHLPPMMLVTGGKESSLLHRMADGYAERLRAAGVPVETRAPEGECHFSVLHAVGDESSPIHEQTIRFLEG